MYSLLPRIAHYVVGCAYSWSASIRDRFVSADTGAIDLRGRGLCTRCPGLALTRTNVSSAEARFSSHLKGGYLSAHARSHGWETLAVYHRDHGRSVQAIKAYEEVVEADPEFAGGYYNLGNLYYDLKQYESGSGVFSEGDCPEAGLRGGPLQLWKSVLRYREVRTGDQSGTLRR